MGSQKNHDEKILSHIKWASELILKESQNEDKRFKHLLEAKNYILTKKLPLKEDSYITKPYSFKFPLGKSENDGIETKLDHQIIIWTEKGFESLEKPHSWFDETKITVNGTRFLHEEYFVLDIVDKSRKVLRTFIESDSKRSLLSEPYSYSETPSIKIVLRERPQKDSKPREAKVGKEKIYPIKSYISSFCGRTGLIPIMIPKSLKPEHRTKIHRPKFEILFLRTGNHSYKPMDYYLQIAIYSIQAGLLTNVDCFVKDFREYLSKKNPKRYPKDNGVLKKALQYITNSYFLPFHSGTFEAYVKRTASALLNRRTASYYQPKINPEKEGRKDIRQYVIRMRMEARKSSKETAKRWLSRKLKDYSLDEIYVDRRYLD